MSEAVSANVPDYVPASLVFNFDIYGDPLIKEDLHASYQQLLELAPPVFYTPCNGGHWILTRSADIREVVKDPEHFSVREMQIPRVPNPPRFIPLSLDPPENIPFRRALLPFFQPKSITAREQRIRGYAASMVAEVQSRGACDFVHDIASRFPVSVFMDIMGMPLERLREFRKIADAFFETQEAEPMERLSAQIIGIMTELIELRRTEPADDLISEMHKFDIVGRPPTLEEMQSMCFILFLGGMDTVTNNMAYAFRYLATDPTLQARLAADEALIPRFVEEGLRAYGVVNSPRIATKDFSRFGVDFKEGDMVLCMHPVANRDEKDHKDAGAFNVDRDHFDHLTFSAGTHLCIGHSLARMELRTLAEEWFKRIPSFRLVPGTHGRSREGTVLALEALPLEWDV